MRLIDADELNEQIGRVELDTREKIFNLVESQPTIETIPMKIKVASIDELEKMMSILVQNDYKVSIDKATEIKETTYTTAYYTTEYELTIEKRTK